MKMKIKERFLNPSLTDEIKTWYLVAYPSDDEGVNLKRGATFKTLLECLLKGLDVYDFIGDVDSIIRERVFEKLSNITGIDYSVIYNRRCDVESFN